MDDLLLHSKTLAQCDNILKNPPQGLLLSGLAGSGKETLGLKISASFLNSTISNLNKHPYFLSINPLGDSISIEDIRSLQQFLKLKVPRDNSPDVIRRVIMIHNAERMRHEAQNALLKTLEEPPTDTCVILTTTEPQSLLQTINSRLIRIEVLPVSREKATIYFKAKNKPASLINKHYALANGQVGLLSALLDEQSHPLLESVNLAKLILQESIGARLKKVDELAKDKQQVRLLLDALQRISHAALVASSTQHKSLSITLWHSKQEAILAAKERLKHNPNIKLLLDDLFLRI